MITLLSEHIMGNICVQYRLDDENGAVGLELLPKGWQDKRKPKRQRLDPIIQLMICGDDYPHGFETGHTFRGSASIYRFKYVHQQTLTNEDSISVITILRSEDQQELTHNLTYYKGEEGIKIVTNYCNGSDKEITLEMLTSFSLGGITPFIENDAPESMVLHRLRSKWSNEGRLDSASIEDLQLEPTWAGHGSASEKFGQVGSMPVRRFFPFVAVEDIINKVVWGAQIACPSSWQIEVFRKDDGLCVSSGLADYDFGHWRKTFKPGESLETPAAYLSVCAGDLDLLCSQLTKMQERALLKMSLPEKLPVVFNEFCTTWGNPSQENIESILKTIKGHDIDYFVIDAGWYMADNKNWCLNMGDWQANRKLFPNGIKAAVDAIKEAGIKPGIWFEHEVCGREADAYKLTEHLLKRNGFPITAGDRRFWDMRNKWVIDYLDEHVIEFLRTNEFEYVKIDYNDSIGTGCDGADSLGEGLRQNMLAARSFLERIREKVPGILIENCSSGGHRLEPSLLGTCQLASFSDAHEEREIPVIAANLHRTMLPRQSLIWAVLRKDDSPGRLIWSLSAAFLGVMCLSGDVYNLSAEQWEIVDKAIKFYREVSHIIENGTTVRHGTKIASYRHLKGWQAIERTSSDGDKLIIIHVFDKEDTDIQLNLGNDYSVYKYFGADLSKISCKDNMLTCKLNNEACAIHLRRVNS